MKLQWQPILSVQMTHAAFTSPPLRLQPSAATAQAMVALRLRADPKAAPGTLALYAMDSSTVLHPVLQAGDETVLTFMIEATSPTLAALTDLPDPPALRCYSNRRVTKLADALQLDPAIGLGADAQRPALDLATPTASGDVELVRLASDSVVEHLPVTNGRVRGNLAQLPAGHYGLRAAGKTLASFVLLPSHAAPPFGCVEIALRSKTIPLTQRIVEGKVIHHRHYTVALPARVCHLRYTVIGLEDPSARIDTHGANIDFGPLTKTTLNGRAVYTTTTTLPVPLLAKGPELTLRYRDSGTERLVPLPAANAAQISVEPGKGGPQWVAASFVYL